MLMVVVVVVVIGKYTGWHVKKWNIVLYVDRAVSQFQKCLALVIAVKGGHVEHGVQVLNVTPSLHCTDRG